MDIKFLWTWWYRDIDLWNSSVLINLWWENILIDCWAWTYDKVRRKWIIDEVNLFLLTHLHGDHIWNLFHFIAHKARSWWLNLIYINDANKEYLNGFISYRFPDIVDDFINWVDVKNISWITSIDTCWQHFEWMPTYAYYFQEWNEWIYYSGDLWIVDTTKKFLQWLNKDIHLKVFHEVWLSKPNTAHCHYLELQDKLWDYEMYCYHCDHTQKPDDCTLRFVAEHTEFLL